MKVAISQSNYIPWKGYFDNIALVDEFVLYDDMQYTKRDWRNRNKIKTKNGLNWLTIPVEVKGKFFQKINETKIADPRWHLKHLRQIKHAYSKAACYKNVIPFIEDLYFSATQETLSQVNCHFISKICEFLGIDTKLSFSSDYLLKENLNKTERLVDFCLQLNAKTYFTGEAAKNYIEETLFSENSIKVLYFDYNGYPEYKQVYDGFNHEVSILDVLFNLGKESHKALKNIG